MYSVRDLKKELKEASNNLFKNEEKTESLSNEIEALTELISSKRHKLITAREELSNLKINYVKAKTSTCLQEIMKVYNGSTMPNTNYSLSVLVRMMQMASSEIVSLEHMIEGVLLQRELASIDFRDYNIEVDKYTKEVEEIRSHMDVCNRELFPLTKYSKLYGAYSQIKDEHHLIISYVTHTKNYLLVTHKVYYIKRLNNWYKKTKNAKLSKLDNKTDWLDKIYNNAVSN